MNSRARWSWFLFLGSLLVMDSVSAATIELLPGVGGRMLMSVTSMKELRFRSVVLQQHDFSCGSAAVATLLTFHYDHPMTEETAFKAMFERGDQQKIQQEGFSLLDIKLFLEANGYLADGFEVSLDELNKAGVPAIVLITDNGYHHFVVVKGIRDNDILIGDPSLGARVMSRTKFEASWPNRIVFVIHNRAEKARFNTPADWSVRPKSPLGQALSRDALGTITLLRPGRNDF